MDRNHLNNFEREPTKDYSCEVWSKSNQWFRRRCCLKIVDGRTDIRTTTTTTTDGEWSQKLTLSFQLRWANKTHASSSKSRTGQSVMIFSLVAMTGQQFFCLIIFLVLSFWDNFSYKRVFFPCWCFTGFSFPAGASHGIFSLLVLHKFPTYKFYDGNQTNWPL